MKHKKFWAFGRIYKHPQYKIIATSSITRFSDVYARHALSGWEFFAMSHSFDVVEEIMLEWVKDWLKESEAKDNEDQR